MRRVAIAALLALAACSPVEPNGFRVFTDLPYDPTAIEAAWDDAISCLHMDGRKPWIYINPMPLLPDQPNVTGLRRNGRVLVEPSLRSLRHEFVHELLDQNTGNPGREDYASTDPEGCFRVSWR